MTVTSQNLANFQFYAQHSAAAYCNYNAKAGAKISCGGYCPSVEGDGATIVASFGYAALHILLNKRLVLIYRE